MSEQVRDWHIIAATPGLIAAAEAIAESAERQLRERKDWRKNKGMLAHREDMAKRLRHRATGLKEGWWDSDMEAASHVDFC